MTSIPRSPDSPRPPTVLVQQRLVAELGLPSRITYVLLLVFDLVTGSVVASLWWTEPSLPLRTQVAFGILLAIALAWAGVFGWILARRKVLLGHHRIVAGRLAVTCTGVFAGGCLLLAAAVVPLRPTALAAAGFGAALFVVAWLLLARAHSRYQDLLARRDQLLSQLRSSPISS